MQKPALVLSWISSTPRNKAEIRRKQTISDAVELERQGIMPEHIQSARTRSNDLGEVINDEHGTNSGTHGERLSYLNCLDKFAKFTGDVE